LFITDLTWTPRGLNPELRGKRPATNRLGAGSLEPHPITRSLPPTYRRTARTLCWAVLTYLLTPWRTVFLEKLTGSQLVKKFPHFMEPEGSLPQLQVSATCPYPDPDKSSPCPHPTSWRSILILSSHLRLWWAMWLII